MNTQLSSGVAAITGAAVTVHTAVTLIGGSAAGFELMGFSFSTDGAQAGLYLVEVVLSDGTSAGTATNSPSPVPISDARLTTNVTPFATGKNTYTAEPTVLTAVDAFYIPAGAPFTYRYPRDERIYCGPSGHLIGLRVTPPGTTSSVYRCALFAED